MAQFPIPKRGKRSAISTTAGQTLTWQQKLANIGVWLLLLVAFAMTGVGVFALFQLMNNASVAKLEIVGTQSALQSEQVQAQVAPFMAGNYFTSDLEQIRDRALRVSWVDRVVVSRAWPNQIRVRVMPKHAIARWGSGRLLSDDGDVFSEASSSKQKYQLPLMHGPVNQSKVMMRRYNEINQLFSPLGMQLKELYLTDRMTWFMQFNSDVRVIVDQDQTMSKLQRLSHLVATDLKAVWPQVAAVDLRYRNGLALQMKNAQIPPIVNSQFVIKHEQQSVASPTTSTP